MIIIIIYYLLTVNHSGLTWSESDMMWWMISRGSRQGMAMWGWRIPFLVSLVPGHFRQTIATWCLSHSMSDPTMSMLFFLPLIWRSGITTGIHQLNVLDYVWCSASRNSNQTKENHCAEIGNPISSWCFRRKYCPMGSEQTRRIYWLRPFGDGAMWGAPDGDGHAVILRLMYWCHLYAWNQCTAQVYQISWIHLLHPQNASFWWGWWGAFYFSCFRGLLKRIDFVLLHVALSLFGCATGPLGRFKSRVDNLFPPLGVFRLQHVQCTADFQAPHESTGYLPI